jgi:transcriptional regulator with XRE-family HTH domain
LPVEKAGGQVAGRKTEPFKVVGRRLATLRNSRGWSQRQLADLLEQQQSYIAKLELAERRLDILDIAALADAFAMSPAEMTTYLLGAPERHAC